MMPKPPAGAKAAGRRLWRAVLGPYELAEHEVTLLTQAVRVADACADLQTIVDRDGLMIDGRFGAAKPHPAAIELRQQQILLARLVVALRVPLGDQEVQSKTGAPRLQRRGVRGAYRPRIA